MKKTAGLMAVFCLLLSAASALGQTPNYAGAWELDVKKSKLPEMSRIESMTMRVLQDAAKLTVETNTKRAARPEGEMRNDGGNNGEGRRGGGMGRGGGMMGGGGSVTYNLDGKETIVEPENPAGMPTVQVTLVGSVEKDGKLKLSATRKVNTPNGDFTFTTKETWELLDSGKTLKVMRETENRRGAQTSELYFTRNDSASVSGASVNETKPADSSNSASRTPRLVSGGVLNGKALSLAKPSYPAEAREAKAGGGVNVQVTIDEQGNVVSAKAVSGHASLRAVSEEAARASKFTPTLLEGVPVKVRGVIVYNFTAQ